MNQESIKQSEALELIRVRMFFMFSFFRLINRAEEAEKEAVLRWTSSKVAEHNKEDALLTTGVSAGEVLSLGILKTQLQTRSLHPQRWGPIAQNVLGRPCAMGTCLTYGLLQRI